VTPLISPSPALPFITPPPLPSASPAPYDGIQPLTATSGPDSFILNVPYRSQYDGSLYQNSNCGPAALAMVLQAYGVQASIEQIRSVADRLQGTTSYDSGIAIDYLQVIAQQTGLRTDGLTTSDGHYRKWSMADLIQEIRRGYPVITLVHYATLPDHRTSTSTSDHYVVVIGVTGDGFVVNDPAFTGDGGARRLLRPDQLMNAWRDASIPDQAVAFLPPLGKPNLALLDQTSTSNPGFTVSGAQPSIQSAATVTTENHWQVPTPPTAASSKTTNASQSTTAPPPGPAIASWAIGLSQWKHGDHVSQIEPTSVLQSASIAPATNSLDAANRTDHGIPLSTLVVAAVIAAGAIAILKMPGADPR
jgi:hypothetical protein